jgi:hypothetical protein
MNDELIDHQAAAERMFTPTEIAATYKIHVETARRLFRFEEGVVRFGSTGSSRRRQRLVLRVPQSVITRVMGRRTVKGSKPSGKAA